MILSSARDLPQGFAVEALPATKLPGKVLMCPPDFYDVRDVKNDFMRGNAGTVNHPRALSQWQALCDTLESCGVGIEVLEPLPECEDMVFTANPSFNGRRADGRAICVLSRMVFTSRRSEVAAHRDWFAAHGYEIVEMPPDVQRFEGGGDAIWHPGRALIWAGAGARTEVRAHEVLATLFNVPVVSLELVDRRFYHLDTCFCPLSERAALIYREAFTDAGLALIARLFADVIAVDDEEASRCFSCNAAAFHEKCVVIQAGAKRTVERLRTGGFDVREVQTGEFLKSGGSVFCMKAALY
jgi:N-dimethylarginine dimethylaminohydrolase